MPVMYPYDPDFWEAHEGDYYLEAHLYELIDEEDDLPWK